MSLGASLRLGLSCNRPTSCRPSGTPVAAPLPGTRANAGAGPSGCGPPSFAPLRHSGGGRNPGSDRWSVILRAAARTPSSPSVPFARPHPPAPHRPSANPRHIYIRRPNAARPPAVRHPPRCTRYGDEADNMRGDSVPSSHPSPQGRRSRTSCPVSGECAALRHSGESRNPGSDRWSVILRAVLDTGERLTIGAAMPSPHPSLLPWGEGAGRAAGRAASAPPPSFRRKPESR